VHSCIHDDFQENSVQIYTTHASLDTLHRVFHLADRQIQWRNQSSSNGTEHLNQKQQRVRFSSLATKPTIMRLLVNHSMVVHV